MRYKLLLIEDNALDLNLFQQMLGQSGLDVELMETATNLEKGLFSAKRLNPDIIFLDLTLDDSDGIDTFRKTKASLPETPIVIITGNEDEKIALQALREGAQDYMLKKNITPMLISRAVLYAIERKTIEAELIRSKSNNEALLENTKDGIWSLDMNMNITLMNSQFIEVMHSMSGKTPVEGSNILEYLPKKYHNWFNSVFNKAVQGERFINENNLEINNNSHFLEFSVNPIKSSTGAVNGVSFFARNINQRKNAEIKIKKSEDAYKLLLETINDGVMFIDNDNIIRFANRKFIETTGYSEEELRGKDISSILSEQDALTGKKIVAEILSNEEPKEVLINTKNNSTVWFSVKGTPLLNEKGIVGGTLLTHTEITDRKKAEQTIKKKEQDYSNLLETMNEGLVYLDKNGNLKFANKKFEFLSGFEIDSLHGNKLPKQIFPETLFSLLKDDNGDHSDSKNNYQYELQITRSSGDKLWCMISCSIIKDDTGNLSGLLITYADISDRKKTEDKLQVAQRDLNTFIYRSSHDLKGPLSSILGLINILEKDEENSTHNPCIKMIKQSAEKLDQMLNEMLNVVRIKREKIFPEVFDFRSELSVIVQGLRTNDEFYSVRRDFDIENRKDLRTDKKLLQLILHNLLDNAIKYHNPEADSFVAVRVFDYMHGVKIIVEDNGIGFKKAAGENIFNMFNKGSYKSDGNGLGLYVVKNAVDRLGGYIELSCETGSNTKFTIFLPDLFSTNEWVGKEDEIFN